MPYRTRSRSCHQLLALGLLIAAQGLVTACALAATPSFSGHWIYKQACGWDHSATLDLVQTGDEVSGTWSDGTRISGSEGSLVGEVREGTLFVRFCGDDEHAGLPVCPKYGSEVSDRLVRQDDQLTWYQGGGSRFDKYLVLHPSIDGKAAVVDSHCSDDEN